MSNYRFKLITLQKLRIAERDQRRAALADGYRAENMLVERRTALVEEAEAVRATQRKALSSPYTNINQLVEAQRYEMILASQQKQLTEQAARLAIEVERRRLALVEADRAVHMLEKLDEKRRTEHKVIEQRREARALDEVAGVRHRSN